MDKTLRKLCAAAMAAAALSTAGLLGGEGPIKKGDPAYGALKDVKVYMQEWHVWWGFPYPDPKRAPSHLSTTMCSFLEPWRLDWDRNNYPYIGLYDSENLDVVRWQIRCMKACGIEAPAVMIHPAIKGGELFIQETNDSLTKLLNVAAEENYPVFFMDEVAFMQHDSRDPVNMTKRIIRFIKRYGSHPGFLKIDGKPVYYYQTFGFWLGKEVTEKMIADVEKEVGPVYWMMFGDVKALSEVEKVKAIVCGASGHYQDQTTRKWDWSKEGQDVKQIVELAHKAGKKATNLNHIKFENTSQPWRTPGVSLYGYAGKRLVDIVLDAKSAKSDFLMLSSWNDYEESTFMEPAWDSDGFNGDPYLYCKIMAALKGIEFIAPPPPPKEALHPSIWEKLGYGDGAGPIIDSARRGNQRGGSIEVVARDTMSEVTDLEIVWNGDFNWMAPQPGQEKATGNLKMTAGALGAPETIVAPIHKRIQIGNAQECQSESLRFESSGAKLSSAGGFPAVGAVYAFDILNPTSGLAAELPLVEPYVLNHRPGSVEPNATLRLAPTNKPEDLGAYVMEGWQARVAMPPAKIDFEKSANSITFKNCVGDKLAQVSVLGEPKAERCVKPSSVEDGGRKARFYIEIPVSILETPGLACLWLRAKDSAGNWGSPKLLPVSNYEFPDNSKAQERKPKTVEGAAFSNSFESGEGKWRGVWPARASVRPDLEQHIVSNYRGEVSNELMSQDFEKPLEGSFELSFKMLHTKAKRSGALWITDASGAKGYGVVWNNNDVDGYKGEGCVSIEKIDKDSELKWDEREAKRLCKPVPSGHKPLLRPMAEFKLVRDAGAGTLKLFVDGVERCSASDNASVKFERIYLRGNDCTLFDDIVAMPAK